LTGEEQINTVDDLINEIVVGLGVRSYRASVRPVRSGVENLSGRKMYVGEIVGQLETV